MAGLRGAADSTGDGQVTLSEAFAYANRLTIRDTAINSRLPQHPSFDLRLRGRQDVVLTSLSNSTTQLVLAQTTGPLEVVQLSTGITVAEAAPGEQVLRLTLPPGPYLVRRLTEDGVRSKEVLVKESEATHLSDASGRELRLGLSLGAGVMVLGEAGDATRLSARPTASASLEITWMLVGAGLGGLGIRLGVSEVLGFAASGLVHVPSLNLALVGTAGSPR